jgi:large subunit ribosomal protein L25
VIHIDFVIVRRDEVISAEVPINLIGDPVEVNHGDGMVEQQLFTLPVRALPTAIPNSIELDISELTIGASLRVADLTLPEGATADIDPESTVAIGLPPRVEVVAQGAEGEPVAGAAGEPEGQAASTDAGDEG